MNFGKVDTEKANGLILAHTHSGDDWVFKKGRKLSKADCILLLSKGINYVIAAELGRDDVNENDASYKIASLLSGDNTILTTAFTGRSNLKALADGVVLINKELVDKLNSLDESIAVSTLHDMDRVNKGQVVATIKIIPFAVSKLIMDQAEEVLKETSPVINIKPFLGLKTILINTQGPSLKDSIIKKTNEITNQRIETLGGQISKIELCRHDILSISNKISNLLDDKPDLILICGSSVSMDRNDIVPQAIIKSGGTIIHFGMPTEPGNLVVVAEINSLPILVLPGCARSSKRNGIDILLERIFSNLPLGSSQITALGVGGLIKEKMAVRKSNKLKSSNLKQKNNYNISAVVLAAGQSRRMSGANKLLKTIEGIPLIRRVVLSILGSGVSQVVVVTGFEKESVEDSLSGLDVDFSYNDDYKKGLSSTLKIGIEAVNNNADGALICLGDMPAVNSEHIDLIVEPFNPQLSRSIIVPKHYGMQGNPVLWGRQFFNSMLKLNGDIGARRLIELNEEFVYEVEFEDTATQIDLDTQLEWTTFIQKSADF